MISTCKKMMVCASALLALGATAPAAAAENYPAREVTIVVPYTPGGFNDTLARTASQYLGPMWNQSVVVLNKPGGNTLIGNSYVAGSKADGYTLLITPLPFSSLPGLYGEKLPYDAQKDFEPVIWAASAQNALVVPEKSPFKSVKELIDYAKANPGKVNYGSTGTGSSNHLSMELFMNMTDTKMTHIPYKGSAPAVVALLGSEIDVLFDNIPNVIQHIKSGKFRALATTGMTRSAMLPDTPTVDQAGVPGYEVNVWFGIQAPAGTPKPIIQKLNADLTKVLKQPEVIEKFGNQGVEVVASTPEEFKTRIDNEIKKWTNLVKAANIKIE
ncbi:MAG: tripartite tricarboxylate transporter substrate binding protein [Burkholderiaceae bacterium]